MYGHVWLYQRKATVARQRASEELLTIAGATWKGRGRLLPTLDVDIRPGRSTSDQWRKLCSCFASAERYFALPQLLQDAHRI